MSITNLIGKLNDTIECLQEENYVEPKKETKSQLRNDHSNIATYDFFYSQDSELILVNKQTFDNWLYYLGFEYCEKSNFSYLLNYVLIDCSCEDRLTNFYEEILQLEDIEPEEKE